MESTFDPDQKADEKDCEVVKVGKNIEQEAMRRKKDE